MSDIDPEFKEDQSGGGGGAGKACAIACLVLFILAIVGAALTVYAVKRGAREVAALTVETGAELALAGVGVPKEDHDEVMGPISSFTQEIRDGDVSLEQGQKVAKSLEGVIEDVGGALIASRFDSRYLQKADVSDEEKKKGHVVATRFAEGKLRKVISGDEVAQISALMTTSKQVTAPDGTTRTETDWKPSLTKDEIAQILQIMKQAADDGGVEDKEFDPDLATPIQKAIDAGMGR